MAEYVDRLVHWLKAQGAGAGAAGAVVGISGGVDSAVVAALLKRAFPATTLGIIMPCDSLPRDIEDARLVAKALEVPYKEVDLGRTFRAVLEAMGNEEGPGRRLAEANLKPRLRMLVLYYHANLHNYLVVGTGNRSELKVGYFTKHGDGGVDLLPLARMVKSQVKEAARLLGVPCKVIEKPPTAGLWPGQTDEAEMGVTYDVLDNYILAGEAPEDARGIIESMARRSAHKLSPPVMPDFEP
jgi:NAD+ synthase